MEDLNSIGVLLTSLVAVAVYLLVRFLQATSRSTKS